MQAKETDRIRSFMEASNFQGAADLIIGCLEKGIKNIEKKRQKDVRNVQLAHYTDIETVVSIIRGGRSKQPKKIVPKSGLRLYDAYLMNDPREGDILWNFISHLPKSLQHRESESRIKTDAYVVSFVGNETKLDGKEDDIGDNLLHWRLYGRDGEGCSIQFFPSNTESLWKVLYEKGADNLVEEIKTLADLSVCLIHKMIEGDDKGLVNFADNVKSRLNEIGFMYKDASYQDEKEYRFVIPARRTGKQHYQFRRNPKEIPRKYIHAPKIVGRDIIFTSGSKVFVGPRVRHKEHVRKYLKHEAENHGLSSLEIISSKIPYQKF